MYHIMYHIDFNIIYIQIYNIFLRDSPFLVDGPEHHQLQKSSTAPGVVWMPPAQHCAIRAQGRESHLRRGQENHLTGPAQSSWRLDDD